MARLDKMWRRADSPIVLLAAPFGWRFLDLDVKLPPLDHLARVAVHDDERERVELAGEDPICETRRRGLSVSDTKFSS